MLGVLIAVLWELRTGEFKHVMQLPKQWVHHSDQISAPSQVPGLTMFCIGLRYTKVGIHESHHDLVCS